jgi:N-acetylglucosamine-6-phosphate deacetylase
MIDVGDKTVCPGFIDTHIHGWQGHHFGDSLDSTLSMCASIAETGTTSLLPALMTEPTLEAILDRVHRVRHAMQVGTEGATILGIHMEGPFLSKEDTARGSQEAAYLRDPCLDELRRILDAGEGAIRKMTVAPELPGMLELIEALVAEGVVVSAGHTAASYEQAMQAISAGLSCATHVFNGMLPLHHRRPGLLGAVLTSDRVSAELIADGEHVAPPAMQVLLRCKGAEGVHLITDNTLWAGLEDGEYPVRDGRVIVKDGNKAFVKGGTLMGSVAPLNYAIANVAASTQVSLAEAIRMASLNPARVIGIDDRKGDISPGKDADLVVIDDDVRVHMTMVGGEIVYQAS